MNIAGGRALDITNRFDAAIAAGILKAASRRNLTLFLKEQHDKFIFLSSRNRAITTVMIAYTENGVTHIGLGSSCLASLKDHDDPLRGLTIAAIRAAEDLQFQYDMEMLHL